MAPLQSVFALTLLLLTDMQLSLAQKMCDTDLDLCPAVNPPVSQCDDNLDLCGGDEPPVGTCAAEAAETDLCDYVKEGQCDDESDLCDYVQSNDTGTSDQTPAPTSLPASTPTPTSQQTVATLPMEIVIEPEEFDVTAFTEAVAASSGVDASHVEVASVAFVVEVAYEFGAEVTESQAKTVIADANSVPESSVAVAISRRLQDSGARRLSSTTVSATITSTDSSVAAAVKASNEDAADAASVLAAKLQETFAVNATVTQTVAPAAKAVVSTRITATEDAIASFDNSAITDAVATATGGTVQLGVIVVGETDAPTPGPRSEVDTDEVNGASGPALPLGLLVAVLAGVTAHLQL